MNDFAKGHSANMRAIRTNLKLDGFLESTQSNGFAIVKVEKDSIQEESMEERAKVLFKGL